VVAARLADNDAIVLNAFRSHAGDIEPTAETLEICEIESVVSRPSTSKERSLVSKRSRFEWANDGVEVSVIFVIFGLVYTAIGVGAALSLIRASGKRLRIGKRSA
jgi:hypothetical protein